MKEQLSVGQALSQAFAHLDAGRIDAARRLGRALVAQRPEPPGLAYLLGLLSLADGQGRKAAQHLARALAQTPDAVPPALAMARAQLIQGRTAEAVAAYRRVLALAPDLAAGWRDLADHYFAARDFTAAAPPLGRALRLAPGQAPLLNNLGIAERARGHLAAADERFRAAIAFDPSAPKPYANLAGARRRQGRPAEIARRAVQIHPEDGACRVELGQTLPDPQALAEFEVAIRLLPGQAEPLWLAAQCLERLGRRDEAADAYRRVRDQDRADPYGAGLALARLGEGAPPDRAAAAHVSALYDQYAESFDRDLLDNLDYRGPEVILGALRRAGIAGPCDILDAGCGTGLAGLAVKPLARRLDGIDLSEKMSAQARARGVYDSVEVGDLVAVLAGRSARYDLVIAADVLIYLGDLAPVAEATHGALRPGGHFAFTVERGDGDGYRLQPSGRFAHAESYLRRIAAGAGFLVTLLEPAVTRRERGTPVPGLLCLLTRP